MSALKASTIRKLLNDGDLTEFDTALPSFKEFTSEHCPKERLMACYNPDLAKKRALDRQALIKKTGLPPVDMDLRNLGPLK